jgi:HK97 family phage major capsid protein
MKARKYPGAPGFRFLPVTEIKPVERAEGDETPQRFTVAVSSEFPVERFGFFGKYREVLDHSPGSVELARFKSGRAAVLVDHGGDQVGVVRSAWLDKDRVMRAEVQFSANQRGQEIQRDVLDDIRGNISLGYIPKRAKLVEESEELGDLWRVTAWAPLELSFVSVPADPTVGVGRGMSGGTFPPVDVEGEEPKEERSMKKVRGENGAILEVADTDPRPAVHDVQERSAAQATAEAGEMYRLAEAFGYKTENVRAWQEQGLDITGVQRLILNERATQGAPTASAESLEKAGLARKDLKRYSFARAILAAAERREPDGLEGEVHRWLVTNRPTGESVPAARGGVLVPTRLMEGMPGHDPERAKRSLVSNVAGKGAETVFEEPGELIELLRNRTVLTQLGARTLTGLTSPVAFPKQTAGQSAVWVGEGGAAISETDLVLALALLAPKTLMGATSFSRQLLMQGSVDTEQLVREDIAQVHAIALDVAGIHGLGAAGEPTGVYKAVGVNLTDRSGGAGAIRYSDVLAMEAQVANANAHLGSLGWLANPSMSANMKAVMKGGTGTWSPLWDGTILDGNVDGYRAMASAQVSKVMTGSDRTGGSNMGVVFGNWADMLIGMWGALELVVDPYTSKKRGLIEVASFQMTDILIRHGESFSKGTNFTG